MRHKVKHVHFVGIGGSGMSGIAEVMLNLNFEVTGSDLSENAVVARLRSLGVRVNIGHDRENIAGADAVVTSTAVKADNPEVAAARSRRIPVVPRAMMLAELMRLKQGIAVAGTHGKTTTTSLVAWILECAGRQAGFLIGGIVTVFGGMSTWARARRAEKTAAGLERKLEQAKLALPDYRAVAGAGD